MKLKKINESDLKLLRSKSSLYNADTWNDDKGKPQGGIKVEADGHIFYIKSKNLPLKLSNGFIVKMPVIFGVN